MDSTQRKSFPHVQAISNGLVSDGTLNLIDFHIIFTEALPEAKIQAKAKPRESYLPYPLIHRCVFRPTPTTSATKSSIRLQFRDFTFITFNFETQAHAREAFDFIKKRGCGLGDIDKLYAFSYKPSKDELQFNGWTLYSPRAEYRRMGISDKMVDKGWRISTINKDHAFSPTYPELLVVPSSISDNVIKYAGAYRSRVRIPALSYLHPVNNCSITRSSQPLPGITNKRSLQDERLVAACFAATHLGPSASQAAVPAAYSNPDISEMEKMEDDFIRAGSEACYDEVTGKRLIYGAQQSNYIVDARPTINARAMQIAGKGSENMQNYKSASKIFLFIANIHKMRKSLEMVFKAIQDADISPLPPNRQLLRDSGWLEHIRNILDGSAVIARQVGIRHSHVLIHCSDGWDRTSQLSALSQLMLDPYYRTYEGFMILVEKEWLAFGHMFQQRSGHLGHENWYTVQNDAMAGTAIQPGENDGRGGDLLENVLGGARRFFNMSGAPATDDTFDSDEDDFQQPPPVSNTANNGEPITKPNEISPVFHQFLDATYQLLRQHPTRFEFNERFLIRLFYHLYSCQYGTFLYNSELQRTQRQVATRTRSVWDYFLAKRQLFLNPDYDPTVDDKVRGKERLLFPNLDDIRWWYSLFKRRDDEMNGTPLSVKVHSSAETRTHITSLRAASDSEIYDTTRDAKLLSYEDSGFSNVESASTSSSSANLDATKKPSVERLIESSEGGPNGTHPVQSKLFAAQNSPTLPESLQKSVILGIENAHVALTPNFDASSLYKHATASSGEAIATIKSQFANFDLGNKLINTFAASGGTASGTGTPRSKNEDLPDQEMKSMD